MSEQFSLHFFDASRPDDDDVFPVHVYTNVVPRVGDSIHYHVDDPSHRFEGTEPGQITGVVERLEFEYRRMKSSTPVLVSAYLRNYKAEPPRGWRQGQKD